MIGSPTESPPALPEPLLRLRGLTQQFQPRGKLRGGGEVITAVDNVDLDLFSGERLGVVGESGSGKSTLARAIVRLREPSAGSISFDGTDVRELSRPDLLRLRARVQLVLQDPQQSLDPRMTVRQIVAEGLDIHARATKDGHAELIHGTLVQCGIPPALHSRFPAALSGGQRQRVALARSLVLRPRLLLLDEVVSALDVSVQAQILNLLRELQGAHELTYLFIVHDLAVANWFCDRIAVMKDGRIVEVGPSEEVFNEPRHEYTRALLKATRPLTRSGTPPGVRAS